MRECPKCGAQATKITTFGTTFACHSFQGKEFHQTTACKWRAEHNDELAAANARIAELEAEVERLKAKVSTYGTHTQQCMYHYGHDCDCGFEEAKADE
jgi:hypothetical protein